MKTAKLKEICDVLSDFVQYVAIRPITDLVGLVTKGGMLYIGHTDKDNAYIVATVECDTEVPSTVVKLSDISKIIKATTVDEISICGKDDYLELKGNGKYKIPIQLDENGDKFSIPIHMPSMGEPIHVKDIKKLYKRNDVFVDKKDTLPKEFVCYYCDGEHTVTTNNIVVACTNGKLPMTEMNPNMMKSLIALPKEFDISSVDGGYRIECDCYRAYYKTSKEVTFPADMVIGLVNNFDAYTDFVNVEKKNLFDSIKRQDIFKSKISTPLIYLTFKDNSITIENKQGTFYEEIPCDGNGNSVKIITSTENLLKILRLMEDDITIGLSSKFMSLEDTCGKYIIANMQEDK